MTLDELNQYKSLIKEIREQEKKIEQLNKREIDVVAGMVQSSKKSFPYTEGRVAVLMEEPKQAKVKNDLIIIKEKRIEQLLTLRVQIERFIYEIKDSELRRIFEMRFIDGMKQEQIAKKVNLDRSVVSRKITDYLCCTQNTN